jgi:hypothetical protein
VGKYDLDKERLRVGLYRAQLRTTSRVVVFGRLNRGSEEFGEQGVVSCLGGTSGREAHVGKYDRDKGAVEGWFVQGDQQSCRVREKLMREVVAAERTLGGGGGGLTRKVTT